MSFTVYDKSTGEILRTGIANNPAAQVLYLSEDVISVESFNPDNEYVKDGVLKQREPSPGVWAVWDLDSEQWIDVLTPEEHEELAAGELEIQFNIMRQQRDALLAASDWTDTVSAGQRLSKDVQDQWAAYRMALRDLPDNTGDPTSVEWPTPPTK